MMKSGMLPVFVNVTVCGWLGPPTRWWPKFKLVEDRVTTGLTVPVRLMRCGLPGASSAMMMAPLLVPVVVGAKVTVIEHAAPAGRTEPQSLV